MPIPFKGPAPRQAPQISSGTPLYVRDTQSWAVDQLRRSHDQSLYAVGGELAYFTLMWHLEDFNAGVVGRCTRCWGNGDLDRDRAALHASAYQQAINNKCPDCYGTTFEGGIRAQIIRPVTFADQDDDEKLSEQGLSRPTSLSFQTTSDFRMRTNDYVFRGQGDRFQLRVPARDTLRTGFGIVTQSGMSIGYDEAMATQSGMDSVAYMIPPEQAVVNTILTMSARYTPQDWSQFETINSSLIPHYNE